MKWVPLVIAALLMAGLDSYVFVAHGAKFGTLLLIGGGLGFTLFHSRYGFTSAFRQLLSVGNAGFYISYALPILGAAYLRWRGRWTPGDFTMGRWSTPATYVAAVWITL